MIATFKKDESYYKEDLNEWISSASRGQKYELYLGELLLLFGIVLLVFFPNLKVTAIAALLIGAYELIKHLRFRKRWIEGRMSSKAHGEEMAVEFKNGEINILKPEADRVSLSISKVRIIVSRKGYFICPKERVHLYVPFSSFSPPLSRDQALKFIQAGHGRSSDEAEPRL